MQILLFDYKCTLSVSSEQVHLVGNNFTQEREGKLLHTAPKHFTWRNVSFLRPSSGGASEYWRGQCRGVLCFSCLRVYFKNLELLLANCCQMTIKNTETHETLLKILQQTAPGPSLTSFPKCLPSFWLKELKSCYLEVNLRTLEMKPVARLLTLASDGARHRAPSDRPSSDFFCFFRSFLR